MVNCRFVKELFAELPRLVNARVISEDFARALRSYENSFEAPFERFYVNEDRAAEIERAAQWAAAEGKLRLGIRFTAALP